jgi:hypothetical protein
MIFSNKPNKGFNPNEVVSCHPGNDLNAIQAAYQQSSPGDQQGPSTPPPPSNDSEDVIDGEYKET